MCFKCVASCCISLCHAYLGQFWLCVASVQVGANDTQCARHPRCVTLAPLRLVAVPQPKRLQPPWSAEFSYPLHNRSIWQAVGVCKVRRLTVHDIHLKMLRASAFGLRPAKSGCPSTLNPSVTDDPVVVTYSPTHVRHQPADRSRRHLKCTRHPFLGASECLHNAQCSGT